MIRRLVALGMLAAGLVALVLAGCAKKKILAVGNLPPQTIVFVDSVAQLPDTIIPVTADTVNHVVHLYWFGTDPDGQVLGYEVRLVDPAGPADPPWVFTPSTDSLIAVSTPTGYATQEFQVRAIDDSGELPPANCGKVMRVRRRDTAPPETTFECLQGTRTTPPASMTFRFTNQPPTVRFTQRLRSTDTTYASVTLAWSAGDPDGDLKAMRFQVGLDTVPSALHLVSGTGVTLDTTDFKENGTYPPTQPRMAFIRAIDDGGRVSGWDSLRWVVRAPAAPGVHPRLLLIDDVPVSVPGSGTRDALYYNAVQLNLPAGSYSILRLEYTQPFRSVKDLAQTCRQFDAVVWYRGDQFDYSSVMRDYQDGLATFLDGGGQLMIESLRLVEGEGTGSGARGALREDWVTNYFGSEGLIRAWDPTNYDSTTAWSTQPSAILRSTVYSDSLRQVPNLGGLRGFAVRDTNFVALWARDSTLKPPVPRGIPVAVTVPVPERPPGPGRVIVFSLPLLGANGFGNAPRVLGKVFQQMGLTGP